MKDFLKKYKLPLIISGAVLLLIVIAGLVTIPMAARHTPDGMYPISMDGSEESDSRLNFAGAKPEAPGTMEKEVSLQTDKSQSQATSNAPKRGMKLIKTGTIRFQVKDYKKTRSAIEDFVKKNDGYIASEEEQNNAENGTETTVIIRFPVDKFDQVKNYILSESINTISKSFSTQDVTEEFVDNEARLKSKRELEARYLTILQRANTVKDILEVEAQLGTIREEIEATEGRLKYLNDQVQYSTLTLTFFQNQGKIPRPEGGFFFQALGALSGGWNILLKVFIGIIYLWPFILLIGVGIWGVRRWKRRKKA